MSVKEVMEMLVMKRDWSDICLFIEENPDSVESFVKYLEHPDPKIRYKVAFGLRVAFRVLIYVTPDEVRRVAPTLLSIMLRYRDISFKMMSILDETAVDRPELLRDVIPLFIENIESHNVRMILGTIYEKDRSLLRNYWQELNAVGFDPEEFTITRILDKLGEPKFRLNDNDLKQIDDMISQFTNISRDNLKLFVEGHLVNYEIDFSKFPVKVKGICKHNHISEDICVRFDNRSFSEYLTRKQQFIKYVTEIAINLAKDIHVIDDLQLLKKVYGLVACPRCIKESQMSKDIFMRLCDRIIEIEDKKLRD